MKKRLISLFLVFVIISSGAFSCLASAATRSPADFFFDKYWEVIHQAERAIEDVWSLRDAPKETARTLVKQHLIEQKNFRPSSSGYTINHCGYTWDVSPSALTDYLTPLLARQTRFNGFTLENKLFTVVAQLNDLSPPYSSSAAFGSIFVYAVPIEYKDDFYLSFENNNIYIHNPEKHQYFYDKITLYYRNNEAKFVSTASQLSSNSLPSSPCYDTAFSYLCYSELDFASIEFNSSFSFDQIDLTINLFSNVEVDSGYIGQFGILYEDGEDRTICGSYTHSSALVGDSWSYSFDLKQFREYVYRKRCGMTGYYGFVSVFKDGLVYSSEFPLTLEPPDGIFEDVEDPPSWDDYRPEPSPAPEFPDITFVYNPNTNYETISNYTVNANSTFNDYFTYFVESSQTINNNINIISDNIIQFGRAVEDFVENGESACLDYIGQLIINFNNDVNAHFDSLSDFIGDEFDTLNHNISVIGDNIVKSIKTQLIPDREVVFDIASSSFPFVSDFRLTFDDHEVEQKDLIVSFPKFGSSGTVRAYFEERSQLAAAPGSLRGDSSEDPSPISINTVEGECYSYNLSEVMRSYGLPQYRTVGSLFILGSTLWSLINISFKIFGLGFYKDAEKV